jgi:transcription termination/antitermination protein NusA
MIDLKMLKKGLEELTEEKRLPIEKVKNAIERSFAAAYQKEYGEKGQIIKCNLNFENGSTSFSQNKIVVTKESVRFEDEGEISFDDPRNELPRYNEERHIMLEDARLLKKNVEVGEEVTFPLEEKDDFGRIALQTAKQVIMQAMREAEREQTTEEFKDRLNTVISGVVERVERGLTFVDLGKASAILPYEEQIPGERLEPGRRIRAYLYGLDDRERGDLSVRLSRTHPNFLRELLKMESSEISEGIVEIVSIAREAGNRSKIAVKSNDSRIDPVGACVGQRGVRINAITSELNGERIDVILHDDNIQEFIKKSLSPANPYSITINESDKTAKVYVTTDEQSLAIGKGGQNVRLAAKLTGYKIDIISDDTKEEDFDNGDNNVFNDTDSLDDENI